MEQLQYCAVKDGEVHEGTLGEVVNEVFRPEFDEKRTLTVNVNGYKTTKYHSYSSEYTDEEMQRDANSFLKSKFASFGWRLYKELDWKG